jgi:hypothetical protein
LVKVTVPLAIGARLGVGFLAEPIHETPPKRVPADESLGAARLS